MNTATRLTSTMLAITVFASGCSSSGTESARAAYDACLNPDAATSLLKLDGDRVVVAVTGDAAKALSGAEADFDALLAGIAPTNDGALTGIGVSMAILRDTGCLVEETGYPGSSDQLKDGDSWEGWNYHETAGVGSETTMTFKATN